MCASPSAYQSAGPWRVLGKSRVMAVVCIGARRGSRYIGIQSGTDHPMDSLDHFASAKLAGLDRDGLRRVLVETTRGELHGERNGRRLLSFSCNDYLNFTQH